MRGLRGVGEGDKSIVDIVPLDREEEPVLHRGLASTSTKYFRYYHSSDGTQKYCLELRYGSSSSFPPNVYPISSDYFDKDDYILREDGGGTAGCASDSTCKYQTTFAYHGTSTGASKVYDVYKCDSSGYTMAFYMMPNGGDASIQRYICLETESDNSVAVNNFPSTYQVDGTGDAYIYQVTFPGSSCSQLNIGGYMFDDGGYRVFEFDGEHICPFGATSLSECLDNSVLDETAAAEVYVELEYCPSENNNLLPFKYARQYADKLVNGRPYTTKAKCKGVCNEMASAEALASGNYGRNCEFAWYGDEEECFIYSRDIVYDGTSVAGFDPPGYAIKNCVNYASQGAFLVRKFQVSSYAGPAVKVGHISQLFLDKIKAKSENGDFGDYEADTAATIVASTKTYHCEKSYYSGSGGTCCPYYNGWECKDWGTCLLHFNLSK